MIDLAPTGWSVQFGKYFLAKFLSQNFLAKLAKIDLPT
jgi:hypothetical protein